MNKRTTRQGKTFLEGEQPCRKRQKAENKTTAWDLCMPREASRKRPPQKKTKDASATAESKPLGQRALPTWGHRGGKPKPTRKNKEKDEETFPHSTCGQPRCCKFKTYSAESTRLWLWTSWEGNRERESAITLQLLVSMIQFKSFNAKCSVFPSKVNFMLNTAHCFWRTNTNHSNKI